MDESVALHANGIYISLVVAVHTHVNSEQEIRTKFRLQREFNSREEKRIVTPYFLTSETMSRARQFSERRKQ